MSFRTVVIKNRCKLEYSLNRLVCRGEEEKMINIDEITTIIVQSTQVSITSALLSELLSKKVKIIFCDKYSNPQAELVPYYGTYNAREKILKQIGIDYLRCDEAWKIIIKRKIHNQAMNLKFKNKESYFKLLKYECDVLDGDSSNREGHAAKVYFNSLFGVEFNRSIDNDINAFMNYGYSIILSAINREIKNQGYLTEIGIHHIGNENPFNLSCDFIEPLRPLIDYYVISDKVNRNNFKKEYIDILNKVVIIDEKRMILDNAIKVYIQSIFTFLFEEKDKAIKFISYEDI